MATHSNIGRRVPRGPKPRRRTIEPHERESRRDSFLGRADDYDAARPGYPPELLESAIRLANLPPSAVLLEIGCGTGQVTRWLAARGFPVLALDRSADMARSAARRLAEFPEVEVRCQDFELHPPPSTYRGVVAATAYHWLDPETRASRCAAALSPGGGLVLLWHTHPAPHTGFFERAQAVYGRLVPGRKPPPSPGMTEERLELIVEELESEPSLTGVERRSHDWSRTYSTEQYLRLLSTYSDHRLLPEGSRMELIGELGSLIDTEYGGLVERPYRTELVVARRAG